MVYIEIENDIPEYWLVIRMMMITVDGTVNAVACGIVVRSLCIHFIRIQRDVVELPRHHQHDNNNNKYIIHY